MGEGLCCQPQGEGLVQLLLTPNKLPLGKTTKIGMQTESRVHVEEDMLEYLCSLRTSGELALEDTSARVRVLVC